jgi:hypothetical protein
LNPGIWRFLVNVYVDTPVALARIKKILLGGELNPGLPRFLANVYFTTLVACSPFGEGVVGVVDR